MGNNVLRIGFIDYLERQNWWHSKEFFYDLISLNLKNHFDTGFEISNSFRKEDQGEHLNKYIHNSFEKGWEENYHEIMKGRELYIDYIRKHDYLFSYEASPGIIDLMEEENKKYCDIRISPIRFLSDVLLAIKTNDPNLIRALKLATIKVRAMKEEANKLQVMYRYQIRGGKGLETEPRAIYVGQTELDTSLYFQKKICRIEDFEEEIKKDSKGRKLYYLSHPAATIDHIEHELSVLKKIDKQCEIINENSYRVLCSGTDDLFIGISSGLLQEAQIFGKRAQNYIPFACPVYFSDQESELKENNNYFQISLDDFLSKDFYKIFLFGEKAELPTSQIVELRANQLRFLHNAWWAYANLIATPDQFTVELGKTMGIPEIRKVTEENKNKVVSQREELIKLRDELTKQQSIFFDFQQKEKSFLAKQQKDHLIKKLIWRKRWDRRYTSLLSKVAISSERRKKYRKKVQKLYTEIQELKNLIKML